MPVRTAYVGTQAAGQVLTSANFTKLPGGWIGYAEVTANQTTITAEVDLTSLTVAVDVGAGRRIKVSAYALFNRTVADGQTALRIKEGATQLQVATLDPRNTNIFPLECAVILTPTTGAHTYKLTALQSTGTGSSALAAAATFPAFILVEDLGPAS